MAFGPIMRVKTSSGLSIEMAPFSRDEVTQFAEKFSRLSVTQYLSSQVAQTFETEQAWYDKILKEDDRFVWGIWALEAERKLIGNFDFRWIERTHLAQATNGIVITDSSYWGKGIASAVHATSLHFAFRTLALVRIKSAVHHGNPASLKAMEKVGFTRVYVERNTTFHNGRYNHQDNLECLNPDDWAWRLWWGSDRPTRKAVEAREKTAEILHWAEKYVTLA